MFWWLKFAKILLKIRVPRVKMKISLKFDNLNVGYFSIVTIRKKIFSFFYSIFFGDIWSIDHYEHEILKLY